MFPSLYPLQQRAAAAVTTGCLLSSYGEAWKPTANCFISLPPMEGMLKQRELFSDCIHLLNTGNYIFMMCHRTAEKIKLKSRPHWFWRLFLHVVCNAREEGKLSVLWNSCQVHSGALELWRLVCDLVAMNKMNTLQYFHNFKRLFA